MIAGVILFNAGSMYYFLKLNERALLKLLLLKNSATVNDCEKGIISFLIDEKGVYFFIKLSTSSEDFNNIIVRGKKLMIKNLIWDGSLREEKFKGIKTIDDETTIALNLSYKYFIFIFEEKINDFFLYKIEHLFYQWNF